MGTPLDIYRLFQQYLFTNEYARLPEVVDVSGYTEQCVGLTDWTTGLETALANFQQNVSSVLSDMRSIEETVVEGADTVVIRSLIEATHSGTFLGIAPTGRRVAFEAVDMLRVADHRIVWRYLLFDLYGIQQQLQQPQ
jgi:predicted ester cyclase